MQLLLLLLLLLKYVYSCVQLVSVKRTRMHTHVCVRFVNLMLHSVVAGSVPKGFVKIPKQLRKLLKGIPSIILSSCFTSAEGI